ncbi:MAG TPA: hypothetical protein VHT96_18520 [Clostridia bacterium]|nr:hypothetical protein [Clostridia bacterium]
MYVAIDINRTDSMLYRINTLNRQYADIHERFLSLSRQIDMEVQNKEAVRTALRRLEQDMESVGRAIKKTEDVLEQILEEYRGASRQCLRYIDDLAGDVGNVLVNNASGYPSTSQTFNEYIIQINNRLDKPVDLSSLIDPKVLKENGFNVSEVEIEENIPVLTWKSPLF